MKRTEYVVGANERNSDREKTWASVGIRYIIYIATFRALPHDLLASR